jgi:hypothetical protein
LNSFICEIKFYNDPYSDASSNTEIKLIENQRWYLVFFVEFDQLISLDATKR